MKLQCSQQSAARNCWLFTAPAHADSASLCPALLALSVVDIATGRSRTGPLRRALSEVGAGINIGPNASRVLHRLGIAEELGRTGIKPVTFDQRRWDDGRVLLRSPLGCACWRGSRPPHGHDADNGVL
jgi:hypothetical protein